MSESNKDITIKIPRRLDEDVIKFVSSTKGKRFTNKSDFYKQAIRKLLEDYEGKTHIEYSGLDESDSIILKDHDLGEIVTLSITGNKRKESILVCNSCNDPGCVHRNFVKGHKPLWSYLSEHNLKIVNFGDNP